MSVQYDKLASKYVDNTRLWLRDLHNHRSYLKELILGEEGEWRRELEFLLKRTDEAIEEARAKLKEEDFLVSAKDS